MRGEPPAEMLKRRKSTPAKKLKKPSPKKNRWLDPLNLGLGIAGLAIAGLGLRAGPIASQLPPLDPHDVLTTPIEIRNNGILDLNNFRIVALEIKVDYVSEMSITDCLALKYVPPTKTLAPGDPLTVPFGKIVKVDGRLINADVAIIAFYHPAFMPFWHKRKAFRFTTARQSNRDLMLQQQPPGDALEIFDKLFKGKED